MDRMSRICEMLKREISVIVQTELNDPRVHDMTITKVDVSRDLRVAKVICLLSGDEKENAAILKGLKSAAGFIRGQLGRSVEMKFVPGLTFVEDKEEDEDRSIDKIFERVEKEHAEFQRVNMEGHVMETETIQKIVQAFRERNDFLITAHVNPKATLWAAR